MLRIPKEFLLKWHKYIAVISIALALAAPVGSDCSGNPCMYGICVDDPDSSYQCYCIDGYTGINCEINWDDCWSHPCLNGGTCNDAIAFYNCTCLEGYVGLNCEQKYSECMNDPCLNNGTCLDHNGFTCQCLEGFSGEFCEIDVQVCNETICKNGGECREGPGLQFACDCPDGWAGQYCESDVNECANSPCRNGGLCINEPGSYTCACLFGFTGKECEKQIVPCDDNPCQNRAVCLYEDSQPTCYCVPDYHGSFCELRYDDCESKHAHCDNGGTCVDGVNNYTCSCPPQYGGEMCTILVETTTWPTTYLPDTYTFSGLYTTVTADTVDTVGTVQTDGEDARFTTDYTSEISTSVDVVSTEVFETTDRTDSDLEPQTSMAPEITMMTTIDEGMVSTSEMIDIETTELSEIAKNFTQDVDDLSTTPAPESRTEYEFEFKTEYGLEGQDKSSTILPDYYTSTMIDKSSSSITPRPDVEPPNATSTGYSIIGDTSSTEQVFTFEEDFTTEARTLASITTTMQVESSSEEVVTSRPFEVTSETSDFSQASSTLVSDTDYDETSASNTSQGYSYSYPYTTEMGSGGSSSMTEATVGTPIQHVTMLSSTIYVQENATRDFTQDQLSSLPTSTAAHTIASVATAEADLTTLMTDFYRTTSFLTDPSEGSTDSTGIPTVFSAAMTTSSSSSSTAVEPTTDSKGPPSCTRDQCTNISLCLYNNTQCDCSYPGNCRRQRPSIANAAFNGKSYVRQKFTVDDGLLNIAVRLKTRAKSGILIHALFDDERYILLYVETGQLKFQFSCGLQTMLFGELDSPVNNGFEVDVEIRFQYIVEDVSDKCLARLLVNSSVVMSGEQVLQAHGTMPQYARLHLGGIPVAFTHQFPQIVLGFIGCMSSLKMNGLKRDFIYDSVEAVQIEKCNSFLCLSNPCKNYGACEEMDGKIKCKCIAGYSGETCEKSVCDDNPCRLGATCLISPGANFICVCPLGTHGLFCEKDTTIRQPSFTLFSPGLSSYMAYGISASLKDNMELKLRIMPQTLDQISLIAYMGQGGSKPETSDHFSVTYVRGYVMLTWDLGSGVRRIFTDSPLNVRPYRVYTLQIGRRGRDSWLFVDGIGNVTGRAAGTNTRLDVSPILYIGGHKTKYFESLPHDLPLHTGFSGCIYDIELRSDGNVFPLTMSSPATGRGVGECHRNECSHHSCKNGAVCLNYGPTYSCICMKDWEGPDCSTPANCTLSESLCHNN